MMRRISAGTLRKGGIGAIEDFGIAVANSWTSIGAEGHSQCRQALMNFSLLAPEGRNCELSERHCESVSKAESLTHFRNVGDIMSFFCKHRLCAY